MRACLLILLLIGTPLPVLAQCQNGYCPLTPRIVVNPQHRPILVIEHNRASNACHLLAADFRRGGSLTAWLKTSYQIQWREVPFATDLPRFRRQGRATVHGYTGEDDLRSALEGRVWQPAPRSAPATLPSVDRRFSDITDRFTDQLSGFDSRVTKSFDDVLSLQRGTKTTLDGVAGDVTKLLQGQATERALLKQQIGTVVDRQSKQTSVIERLHERVETVRSNPVVRGGIGLLEILAGAGLISIGGGAGWGIFALLRRFVWKSSSVTDDAANAACPKCRAKDRRISELERKLSDRPPVTAAPAPPEPAGPCRLCREKDERIAQLESENRALNIEVQEFRNNPPPTERIIRVPDDGEARMRRAMEIVRREFPTTPSYEQYRKLVEQHNELLKSGDGVVPNA